MKKTIFTCAALILLLIALPFAFIASACDDDDDEEETLNYTDRTLRLGEVCDISVTSTSQKYQFSIKSGQTACFEFADLIKNGDVWHSVFLARAAGGNSFVSKNELVADGTVWETGYVEVTDEEFADQSFDYDGSAKAFAVEPYGDVSFRFAYKLDGRSVAAADVVEPGIYDVTITITNSAYPNLAFDIERGLIITSHAVNPRLSAATPQHANWTGEPILPEYSAAAGAEVKVECATDRTAPGEHTVRLYVENSAAFTAAEATVALTIDPQVTFIMDGGKDVRTMFVEYGGNVNTPEPPDVPGKTFLYWLLRSGGTSYGPGATIQNVTENLTLEAQYTTITTYEITFKMNDKTQKQTVRKGEMPAAPSSEVAQSHAPAGHTFTGWNPQIEKASKDATYTAQYRLRAQAATITIPITFKMGMEDLSEETAERIVYVAKGSMPNPPSDEEAQAYAPAGRVIRGWEPLIGPAEEAKTYYAQYINGYTVTFVWPDEEQVVHYVPEDDPFPAPPTNPDFPDGTYFWYPDEYLLYDPDARVNQDYTFTATYEGEEGDGQHTESAAEDIPEVTFRINGQDTVKRPKINGVEAVGGSVTAPEVSDDNFKYWTLQNGEGSVTGGAVISDINEDRLYVAEFLD